MDWEQLYGLSGKVAVVTGGGGVLCSTISRALAAAGASVAVLDLDDQAAGRVAGQINADGGSAVALRADVLDRQSLETVAGEIRGVFGRLDILVNGAGGNDPQATTGPEITFFDLPAKAIERVVALNFLGTLLPCQVFGRLIAQQGEGCVINLSSMAGLRPLTRVAAYSAAKAAVTNFTQWLAVYMSENYSDRIRVNAIAPGFFLTHQNRYLLLDEASGDLTERGRQIIQHTPLRRFGVPQDLVGAVLWLASPSAAFVHGAVIPVDGGFSAFGGV